MGSIGTSRADRHAPVSPDLRTPKRESDALDKNWISRVGRILRRHRIDELPQVLNIIKGEMSWIGPRPEAELLAYFYEMQIPFYGYRYLVRSGITGWAQVNQGHVVEVDQIRDKLNYDFFYIKNFSAWLDVLIAGRTLKIMLLGKGAR